MLSSTPTTLTEAIRYYSDEQTCIDAVAAMKWVGGKPVCPKCETTEGERKHYWLAAQKRWKCYSCRKQFSVKVNTPFEDSPLSLEVWLIALWMLVNCRNGVSSYEIARATGIAQKSAWFVLSRLRLVLKVADAGKLAGKEGVEIDETFVGSQPKNWHHSKREKHHASVRPARVRTYQNAFTHQTAILGMLDRESREIRAKVVPNVRKETLQKEILGTIEYGSDIYTDQAVAYTTLRDKYVHQTVNHSIQYVNGSVHTNSLENFWSLTKRNLKGTYVAVEPFHLDRYLDEQVFRFNNRIGYNDGTRFQKALSQVGGKRLTWMELTGKMQPKGV
ncbi:IS1595 family transposase [Granulicella paludicola]|uniref:IS1595 family transposase n=1 Tax=Granulicella paludicola TaxID=474951 RepID=UPI0021DF4EFE|nr:IS1595 family transposase [Granulicella paludicola]